MYNHLSPCQSQDQDIKSLPDNFLFSKCPQFQPLLKYWGHLKNFYSDTTNSVGVDGKNSPSTPQIVVSMAKIHLRHHNLWYWWQKFTFDAINVVSIVNFYYRHHNLWCRRWIFAIDTTIFGVRVEIFHAPPIFQRGLKLWGFGKQKVIWKIFVQVF